MSKDKKIDGRTEKEIRIIAISGQMSDLTDKQFDHFNNVMKKDLYGKQNKRDGGMIKGYSPISRPQRFKGVF